MKLLLLIVLLYSNAGLAQFTASFIVDINEQSIKVTSPKQKKGNISIIIKNNTFDKIISELRSKTKVLKRFVLQPEKKEIIQVDFSKVDALYYVPVSPPFEAVELKFNQRPYEVPEKK
ncbi:MAG: hypothetical protein HON90_12385 [Halobacteriovoraceae bacterium]|jgi:hypothetical protein|nr:hypothetical protein [Halobacteriovoraceae bacterium]